MTTNVVDRELKGQDFSVFLSFQTEKDEIDENPLWTPVRRTDGKTNKVITYAEDPSVNGNGQGLEQIEDGEDLSMTINSVATKQTLKLLSHAIHSAVTVLTLAAKTDIAATGTGFTSGALDFDALTPGDGFWIGGFVNTAINKFYIILTKATDGVMTTYPAPPATEAAGASIIITARKYSSAQAPTYAAAQTRSPDLSKTDDIDFHTLYNGLINSMSVEVAETGLFTASVNYVFEKEVEGTAAIAGQTTAAKPTDRALTSRKNALAGIRSFYMDDEDVTCTMKSLSFEVNNNMIKDDAAGCSAVYIRGQPSFSGSGVVRSRISSPFDVRDKQRNATRTMFGIRVAHGSGHESYLVWRRTVITEASQPDGNNVAANTSFSFSAEEHIETVSTMALYTNWDVDA